MEIFCPKFFIDFILFNMPQKPPIFFARCIILKMNTHQIFHFKKLSVINTTILHLFSSVGSFLFYSDASLKALTTNCRPEGFIFSKKGLCQSSVDKDCVRYFWVQDSGDILSLKQLWDHTSDWVKISRTPVKKQMGSQDC